LDGEVNAKGIYFTVNPCIPDIMGRAAERIGTNIKRTKDSEIESCKNFFIDIDPARPSGVSSTDAEHELAIETAKAIQSFLSEKFDFPEPLIADSGNGAHLIYKIDLPNRSESQDILKRCLKALAEKFGTEEVEIDTTVCNPARLSKLYGTMVRKGDSTEDRPHRRSRIISIPDSPIQVPEESLKKLGATVPEPTPSQADKNTDPNSKENSFRNKNIPNHNLDIKAYLEHYDLISEIKSNGDSIQFVLPTCLFDTSHTPNKASIIQHADGMLSYQCFHKSCKDKTWKDARKKISGDAPLTPFMKNAPIPPSSSDIDSLLNDLETPVTKKNTTQSAKELLAKEFKPVNWISKDFIPPGLTLLAGKPKIGKSILALNLAINIAQNTPIFDQYSVHEGAVLYLALEDSERRIRDRLNKMLGRDQFTGDLIFSYDWDTMNNGGLKALIQEIRKYENVKLVIIDTLAKFRGSSRSKDIYQRDYDTISKLKRVADHFEIGIVVIHHLRKAAAEDPFDEISGTTGLSGAADTNIILRKLNRGNNTGELIITGRDVEERSLALEMKAGNLTWKLLGNSEDINRTHIEGRILKYLKEENRPVRSKDIESEMIKRGLNTNTVRGAIKNLSDKGLIIRVDTGLYAHPSISIFSHIRTNTTTNTTV